jgi:integrase
LWAETVQAIQEASAHRPEPKREEHASLLFITKYGLPWTKDTADQTLAKEFSKLLRANRINRRRGLGFYTLRHTFRTVADESKDQPAVDFIMGHEVPHMSAVYRETINDARLKAVTDHVRKWLFGEPALLSSSSATEPAVQNGNRQSPGRQMLGQ